MKTSKQIRQEFISFFESKHHHFVRSAPVVPLDDPTLLFTNSGMNQFKDVFLGTGSRSYQRAANSQKCIRASGKHNDLEDVGYDNYHHTFFEMLGNWSFGDYFKEEAIVWSWELLVDHWNLPKERLWVTVFEGAPAEGLGPDTESEMIWKNSTTVNPEQVLRCRKKDNFWEMGDWGPCGPCSEIHIDLGEGTCPHSKNHCCGVNVDGCWRFMELWNLVFMQYLRQPSGELERLPDKHVDTGMGLERICRVLQKVSSNYETDLFTPILAAIREVTGVVPNTPQTQVAFYVIADHLRSLGFAIADGALPSNEGRGYVLRRMLRRATRYGRVLSMHRPFIYQLVPALVQIMGEAFPEIASQARHVSGVIQAEEESFGATLDRGIEIFHQMVQSPDTQKNRVLSGENAFKLYDTYGFPVDLTRLMSQEQSIKVDEETFEKCMDAQRQRARNASKFTTQQESWTILHPGLHSQFLGYYHLSLETLIHKQASNGTNQNLIVLQQTPFYAESGGQVADEGFLQQGSNSWKVIHVYKDGDSIIHVCEGLGIPDTGPVQAKVDAHRRDRITANHTATHLMHAALHQVIGSHAKQAGSVVNPDYLRFDFTHFEKIIESQIEAIEVMVNRQIRKNTALNITESAYDDAIKSGIMALFGEKYGDVVRVVGVGNFSRELCGGCHVSATGTIGSFRILSEASIATGIRRIVAVTGEAAEVLTRQEAQVIMSLRHITNTTTEQLVPHIEQLLQEKRALEKDRIQWKKQAALLEAEKQLDRLQNIQGIPVLITEIEVENADDFKQWGDVFRQKLKSGIVIVGSIVQEKPSLLCVVSDDQIQKKIHAGEIIQQIASVAEGRGGGKAQVARASAKDASKLKQALSQAAPLVDAYIRGMAPF